MSRSDHDPSDAPVDAMLRAIEREWEIAPVLEAYLREYHPDVEIPD